MSKETFKQMAERVARNHGTGGWQTLEDMVKFAKAIRDEIADQTPWFPLLGTGLAVRRDLLDERTAQRMHYQTLARLGERGGLSPDEALANIKRSSFQATKLREALVELVAISTQSPAPKQDEELLEQLYWDFDHYRNKFPENERIAFKGKLRFYASVMMGVETTDVPALEPKEGQK